MFRRILIAVLVVSALTCFAAPWMTQGVLAQAGSQYETPLNLSVMFSGYLQANGWFKGPLPVQAQTADPQAGITHSLDGGPAVPSSNTTLDPASRHVIIWNACKGALCHDPITQSIQIESVSMEPLTYTPALHKWSFSGTVIEIRQVSLLGMTAQVARVLSRDFYAWVILNLDTETPAMGKIILGSAAPGDQVRVSISGSHVMKDRVDWNQCQPAGSPICRFGWLYDDGPLSLDWNIPLSPSNEFIHYSHPNPSWEQALFWNTEKVSLNDEVAPGLSKHHHDPGNPKPRQPGCLALLGRTPGSCRQITTNDATRLPLLVESPGARGTRGMHSGGNLPLAERTASWAGRVRVPPGADGNLLVGSSGM